MVGDHSVAALDADAPQAAAMRPVTASSPSELRGRPELGRVHDRHGIVGLAVKQVVGVARSARNHSAPASRGAEHRA